MFENLLARYRQPGRQKLFWTILAAKLLGVVALFAVVKGVSFYFATPALADDAAAAPPAYVNPMNTMWTLIAAFLVFFMQAGFMMLEAGFARTRETVNILLEGIVDTCLCGILFWAWGFAFMFGSGNGFIGKQYFFLHGAPETYGTTGVAMLAFFLFQFAFADTCSTITSGAMVGRTGFVGDLALQLRRQRLHLPDPRSLGVGSGRLAQHHPPGAVPRLRRFDRRSHHRRLRRAGGRDCARAAPRPQVQARRRRHAARSRHDDRRRRRRHPVVRLVRLQPGQHAVRDGHAGLRSRRREHHARGLRRRLVGAVLRLPAQQGLGLRHDRERLPRRPRRHHLSLLLGLAVRRDLHRRDRRRGRGARASTWSSTCASTTRSARSPCTACAASGARLSLGLFATGEYGAPTPIGADNSAGAVVTGLFYGGGANQLIAQAIGSAAVTAATFAVRHGADVRGQGDRHAARLQGRRARRARHPRARRPGLPGAPGRALGLLWQRQRRILGRAHRRCGEVIPVLRP